MHDDDSSILIAIVAAIITAGAAKGDPDAPVYPDAQFAVLHATDIVRRARREAERLAPDPAGAG